MTCISLLLILVLLLGSCSPAVEPPHEHTFARGFSYDSREHWHEATCEHTTERSGVEAHSDTNGDGVCEKCGVLYYIKNNDGFLPGLGIPNYSGAAYVAIDGNVPSFTEDDYTTESYEFYSELDPLGRCGVTMACIGIDIMPTEDRGSIGSVKPTGWHTVKYDVVDGKYLYNRCHLIAYQLTGENANKKNLITGTRYLNIKGMVPFENMIADYVEETENHVLFRVTPVFDGSNLLCHGVIMEAYSVEDEGDGISFRVFAYNVQPGVAINYATGASCLATNLPEFPGGEEEINEHYVLNTSTKKYHKPSCSYASSMKEENRSDYTGTKGELEEDGYTACGVCKP